MPDLPRLLAIIGSGETAPTMAKVHRAVFERLGPPPVPAVLLDTPYGFQENADDISARAVEYFRESVGRPVLVATFRSAADSPLVHDTAVARLRAASFIFSGPGSPTYALRQWAGTGVPRVLADKLANGGAIVFASAAALTLGAVTAPIYEAYKAGLDAHWLPGLDLLAAAGLPVALIPHYDNAEGGTHDTRFCYLGERRLAALERELPEGVFVLGVDGHTALILDLGAGTASVMGIGGVTVRARGRIEVFSAGTTFPIDELRAAAARLAAGDPDGTERQDGAIGGAATTVVELAQPGAGASAASPFMAEVERLEAAFDGALASREVSEAAAAVLELDRTIVEWSRDTAESDEIDRARAAFRSMIVRLGDLAVTGTRDPREAVAPFVEALLEVRLAARKARDFAASDRVRDQLVAAGIEVRDTPEGSEWEVREATAPE
jgi:HAMP domain-containing protein